MRKKLSLIAFLSMLSLSFMNTPLIAVGSDDEQDIALCYLHMYQDLYNHSETLSTDKEKTEFSINHYLTHGKSEGRKYFNPFAYLHMYKDLYDHAETLSTDEEKRKFAIWHFLNHAKDEGRKYLEMRPEEYPFRSFSNKTQKDSNFMYLLLLEESVRDKFERIYTLSNKDDCSDIIKLLNADKFRFYNPFSRLSDATEIRNKLSLRISDYDLGNMLPDRTPIVKIICNGEKEDLANGTIRAQYDVYLNDYKLKDEILLIDVSKYKPIFSNKSGPFISPINQLLDGTFETKEATFTFKNDADKMTLEALINDNESIELIMDNRLGSNISYRKEPKGTLFINGKKSNIITLVGTPK
ncbi:MAG: hypothetical protein Q8L85_04500 [Alphaproteobacteria bacterium]|nr:hypothetical protein [Alphaproteobacteria bacterium]